ncbi:nucleotide disphospho-sugar-binding domain-containing protein [Streptosporangium sp. NPDC051023]|uniref:nucleotide disphospho-sugar-binding domain-containing protein n=1 Tax=Streptosporangium sp. NPDC051023 TaxID=3155410 RepID=UPI0034510643
MKVLSVAAPGSGLFLPTVPLAWALRAAGHDVVVANTGAAAASLVSAGFSAVDLCPGRDVFAEFMHISGLINAIPPGQPRPRGGLGMFGEAMADGLLALARAVRPDLILSTLEQGAAPLVAAELGVPLVEQSVRLAWAGTDPRAEHYRDAIAEFMEPTRERLGLPAPVRAAAVVDVRPPSMGGRDTPGHWSMRYVPYNEARSLPEWALTCGERPRICVTLGSVLPASMNLGSLGGLLASFEDLDAEFVLAIGDIGPSFTGPLPRNVRQVGWMPLNALLPTCAAIVHHGGAGTALTALACGVPQLVVPHGADRPENAAVLVRRGVGLSCAPSEITAERLRSVMVELLREQAFGKAATEVRDEIAAQPSPARIVGRLEDLVR